MKTFLTPKKDAPASADRAEKQTRHTDVVAEYKAFGLIIVGAVTSLECSPAKRSVIV